MIIMIQWLSSLPKILIIRRTKHNIILNEWKVRKPRIGDSLAIRCDAQIPAGSEIIRRWYYQNVTTIPVNAMKRVSLLENGDILYFSNIIEKDDGLKIYCQAIEKATRNKFEPVFTTKNYSRDP